MIERIRISTVYGVKDYMPKLEFMADAGWYIIDVGFTYVELERVA